MPDDKKFTEVGIVQIAPSLENTSSSSNNPDLFAQQLAELFLRLDVICTMPLRTESSSQPVCWALIWIELGHHHRFLPVNWFALIWSSVDRSRRSSGFSEQEHQDCC
ncbi:hypothetical protein Bbelb_213760 [Branchiostoma belcheri]|nr:hypothetical protein Bbelb_213760 [Branchiostoma belcheri]